MPERRTDPALGETLWTEACASLHPGKLVRGLARAAEERGARIFERTRVTGVEPGRVTTTEGTVIADRVVVATEAWGSELPGIGRRILPLYSLVLATEPLPGRSGRRSACRAVRRSRTSGTTSSTGSGRATTGSCSAAAAPLPLRQRHPSRVRPLRARARPPERTVAALFPAAAGARFTHHWGGPLGVPARLAPLRLARRRRPRRRRGRLRRRRRRDREPRGPHRRGSRHRPQHRARPPCPGSGSARRGGSRSRCGSRA